ncbi:DUF805 domain-containing protein [Geodermatophilus sp. SYSU D00758]
MSSPSGPDLTKGGATPSQPGGSGAAPPPPGQQRGGGSPYGGPPYGAPQHGDQPYGAPQHGAQPYGAQPYGAQPYGDQAHGAPQGGWGGSAGYAPAPPYAGPVPSAATMSPADAVRSVLARYADFSGRARRAEYWWFVLAYAVASIVASMIDAVLGFPVLALVLGLGLLVPSLAAAVRRLHDTGRSGWWLLLALIPFGGIVVIVFLATEGQPGPNRYGPSTKHAAGGWGTGGY